MTYLLIVVAIVLFAYDPVLKLVAKWREPRLPARESSPTRLEAFNAAEVLVAYYRSVGHGGASSAANAAAQMLFVEPE